MRRCFAALRLALVVASLFATPVAAQPSAPVDGVVVEFFTRPGCPHCARADVFLSRLASTHRGLRLVRRDVSERSSLHRLEQLAIQTGTQRIGVPAVYVAGQLVIGFDREQSSGRLIEGLLEGRAESFGSQVGAPLCSTTDEPCAPQVPPTRRVSLPLFGEVRPDALGLPLFTLLVGLVDGFNPCAMWVLLYLLSILLHVKSRARMAWIAGTFVVVSGAVYFAFMAAWLNAFLLLGASRGLQLGLGILAVCVSLFHLKDFFAFKRGPSLSIPESAKPGIYARTRQIVRAERFGVALVLVVTLAVTVNMVELLCTAGLPALYTHVLAAHDLSSVGRYTYLALYNLAYMLDDTLMVVIAIWTLSQKKLQERGGRWLKLLSGLVMLGLGLALIAAPEWLLWG